MPVIGPRCHELRVKDTQQRTAWRLIYRVDPDAVLVAEVFSKKTRTTPAEVIDTCIDRLRHYDQDVRRK
jgi:phage-related protein